MDNSLQEFEKRVREMSNEELMDIGKYKVQDYRPGYIDIINREISIRQLNHLMRNDDGGILPMPELATEYQRLAAALIDSFVLWGWMGIISVVKWYAKYAEDNMLMQTIDSINTIAVPLFGLVLIGLGGYQTIFLSIRGQTLGKQIMKIKIVDSRSYQNGGFVQNVLLRAIISGVIGVIPFIGWIYSLIDNVFIFSSQKRCVHDRIANTIVIKS